MRPLPPIQKENHAKKRSCIQKESHARAHPCHDQAANCRTKRPRHIKSRRIHRYRRRMLVRRHDLRRNRLPRRIVHHRSQSQQKCKKQKHPGTHKAGKRQNPQNARRQYHPPLRDQQQPPPVHHVRQRPCRQNHQENRNGRRRLHQANHQRRHCELRHQPSRAHVLHPCPGIRDHRRNPQRSEQRFIQRRPRRTCPPMHPCRHRHVDRLSHAQLLDAPSNTAGALSPKGHSPFRHARTRYTITPTIRITAAYRTSL